MKRTTYIFIGVYLLGLLGTITPIIYFTNFLKEQNPYWVNISHENELLIMDLNNIKVIKTGISKPDGIDYINTTGNLLIVPSEDETSLMKYYNAEYFRIQHISDTLHITFDFNHPHYKEEVQNHKAFNVDDLNITLRLSPELFLIENNTNLSVNFQGMKLESLKIESDQTINMDSCLINTLNITGNHYNLITRNSRFENMYLDLDNVGRMEIENCKIHTQYFAGSRNYERRINSEIYKKIIWQPKDENAKLKLELNEPTEILFN